MEFLKKDIKNPFCEFFSRLFGLFGKEIINLDHIKILKAVYRDLSRIDNEKN